MSDLEVGLLILLVLGVIASNLAVLKYSAKHKMTHFGKDHDKQSKTTDKVDEQSKQTESQTAELSHKDK
ncbi:DUF2897 family protein [Shewanella sp. 1CM18E]|uniref:DUF2897 family protein n=1 Tax=Shewanella sp. 1CM18E TaxID=2929169 RepID=UPI0020BDDAE1|nr:DUF2897 family protein [Shewanella sp. 1CM18E]MCK8046492.1 DUF2897 family protein [Shewanella sp. 1CM18E]